MTIQDLFEQLAYGELSHVVSGELNDDGELPEERRQKLIKHIQMGLRDLHTRFLLRERTLVIEHVPGNTLYELSTEFAKSNTASAAPAKFIDDLTNPYSGNLLRVARVYDDAGEEVPLNDLALPESSIETPSFNLLKIPATLTFERMTVVYHEDHPTFDKYRAPAVPFKTEVHLPPTHTLALLFFVASRVLNPIGISPEFHEGNNYAAKYEAEVARLKMMGLEKDALGDVNEHERFLDAGWM